MKLEVASWDSVPSILKILSENFPATKTSYAKLLSVYEQRSEPRSILLTPDGRFDEFATFFISELDEECNIFLETLNPNWEEFSSAIADCPLIKWSSGVIGPLQPRLTPLFEDFSKKVGIQCRDRCRHCEEFYSYHISPGVALSLEIRVPDDISLRRLTEEQAELINQLWPYGRTEQSLQMLKNEIKTSTSLGLFSNVSGELVAFVVQFSYGAPGALHVMTEHRRKGYGEMIMRAMTREMIQKGIWPKVFICLNNFASQKLFEKIGYEKLTREKWHYFQKG